MRTGPGLDPGQGVVGDVVNTASRLQSIAPVGGVVVGAGMVRAAQNAIVFDELDTLQSPRGGRTIGASTDAG